jgi:hypothetical protein
MFFNLKFSDEPTAWHGPCNNDRMTSPQAWQAGTTRPIPLSGLRRNEPGQGQGQAQAELAWHGLLARYSGGETLTLILW